RRRRAALPHRAGRRWRWAPGGRRRRDGWRRPRPRSTRLELRVPDRRREMTGHRLSRRNLAKLVGLGVVVAGLPQLMAACGAAPPPTATAKPAAAPAATSAPAAAAPATSAPAAAKPATTAKASTLNWLPP